MGWTSDDSGSSLEGCTTRGGRSPLRRGGPARPGTGRHDEVRHPKIIDGSIFGSDPWRVHTLMLIAIGKTGDVQVVSEPRKMMALANGLAVAGLPKVIEMLKEGDAEPIWNLSGAVDSLLRKEKAA